MKVPTYDSPQVGANIQPAARFDAPAVPDVAGQQLQQTGQALSRAGQQLQQIEIDRQVEKNQLRFDDAANRAKEAALRRKFDPQTGFLNLKGSDAFQRPDGKDLATEYGDDLRKEIDQISASLDNDAQRQAFSKFSENLITGFRAEANAHDRREFTTHSLSVSDGIVATAMREIALSWNDPKAIDEAQKRIEAETYRKATLLGKSAEWQEATARQLTSGAHALAIQAALENNNPVYADEYLKKYAGKMDADDIMKARGAIGKQADLQIGVGFATQAVQQAVPKLAPTDFDRMVNITMTTESGGRRYGKDGNLLESPKGAKGEMQVLDGTNLDPGFGVKPARDNSPEERARVGRDYLQAMLARYGGDPAKAWAAYNAGPGRLDAALKTAGRPVMIDASTDPNAPKQISWLSLMPKETQTYVAKNMAVLGSGAGTPQRPTLADIDAQLMSNPALAGNPQRMKIAREEAARQWKVQEDAIKQREEGTLAEAQRQLVANGGNYAGLPASVRNAIPPGKVDDVMGFAGKIAKGAPVETDWSLYYQLKTNPDALQAANLMAFRSKLGDAEFKALVGQQEDLRSGKDMTRLRSFGDVLNQYMREAGIDPTPKDTDTSGAEKVGRIWSAFEARVREREQAKGSKLTPEEIQKTAAQLFTKVGVSGMLWDSEKPAVMLAADDKVKVPAGERAKITAALIRAGRPVTEENIVALYRRAQGIN